MASGAMKDSRTLRATPAANGEPVADAQAGDLVETFETDADFIKVRLENRPGKPIGWVSKSAVGPADPVNTTIDKELFARACWRESIFFGVNAHYLAGIAELRSHVTSSMIDDQRGPFGLLAAEWAADWKTPDLFIDKFPVDSITNWRMQCKMFAFMTRCAQDAFLSAFKARASATELFIVQMIGVEGLKALKKDPNRTLSAALGEATAANLPLGNTLIPDVIKRHIKVLGVDVADPTGHQFIAQTAAALVPALTAMTSFVMATGADVLQGPGDTVVPDSASAADINFEVKDVPASRKEVAKQIVAAFAAAGFGVVQQVTALANAIRESGLDPAIESPLPERSFGLFQLNINGGLGTGFPPDQLKQAAFNINVIVTEAKKIPAFATATSLAEAMTIFVKQIERPANQPTEIELRLKIAERLQIVDGLVV
jgi:hypothetical protein